MHINVFRRTAGPFCRPKGWCMMTATEIAFLVGVGVVFAVFAGLLSWYSRNG